LQGISLRREEFYRRISKVLLEEVGDILRGVIVFGSSVYFTSARDVDLIVIVNGSLDLKKKMKLELKLSKRLRKSFDSIFFDIHVMDFDMFKENLVPGSFLHGLALGYEIIYGNGEINKLILNFLKDVSSEKYVIHGKYGSWNLAFHARLTYKRKHSLQRME